MTSDEHPNWYELLAAVGTGDGATPALRRARLHAESCPECGQEWVRVERLLSLLAERHDLPRPSRAAMERAFRSVREHLAPRSIDGLRRVWALRIDPIVRPVLRGPATATDAPSRWLYETPEHRIAITTTFRDRRTILRGQVVPLSGGLPEPRLLHYPGAETPVPIDSYGEFVLDPLPDGLQDLEVQLGDSIVQLTLPLE
ncbi:MAG: hypothetical protein KDA27_24890 [Candidatus Eisenbacteria bacterium]|uniref:Zinc-finger domain-containing protein n=1 Tax=Eiseniibacteriota bacterium TaxID=2212470 RepID=A0A956SI24_UNCEI|nr:hypothetical protein [Candidatus Eisenbacteria bacterium]